MSEFNCVKAEAPHLDVSERDDPLDPRQHGSVERHNLVSKCRGIALTEEASD